MTPCLHDITESINAKEGAKLKHEAETRRVN